MASDVPPRLIRRILVALDASAHSRAALEAAARLAARIDAELVGLFVEDEVLIRMADVPFTSEVRRFPAAVEPSSGLDMERQIQAQAHRVERLLRGIAQELNIPWAFRSVRGDVKAKLLAASEDVDLITLGRLGHSARFLPRVGSVARAVLMEASCPVLVLHHDVHLHPTIVVLYDGSETSIHALLLANEITHRLRDPSITVLYEAGDGPVSQALPEQAAEVLKPFAAHVEYRPSHHFSFVQIAALFPRSRDGLLVVPRSLLANRQGRLERLLTLMYCPVLLVR